ncbi:MAG: L,D-transpeptidase family protein [Candidatus Parcubacteria bacterium]|nr:L,D-transpeptidase family protein [Candidatus Parcubacteria bacterium]
MKKALLILFIISLLLPFPASAATPELIPTIIQPALVRPAVRIFNPFSGLLEKEFYPFPETSQVQGVNVGSGDVNGDGLNEIVVATGLNEKPLIRIFNNKAELINEFQAYADNFKKGLTIFVAKLYPNLPAVIITAPNEGGGPHIRIFNGQGIMITEFFAFDSAVYSGVNVSAGDLNRDGQLEIIAGSGYQSEPKIQIFDNYGHLIREFLVYDKKVKSGVTVLASDVNNDGQSEIITSPYMDAAAEIKTYTAEGILLNKFNAYPTDYMGGVNLTSGDIDNDKNSEIIIGPGFGLDSQIKFFAPDGKIKLNPNVIAFPGFNGGVSVSSSDFDNDGQIELISGMQTISPINKYEAYKNIEIDISKQRIYAYFKGKKIMDFIISTGKNGFPTPVGKFKVMTKVPKTTMARNYGPDNPNNYNLPNVPSVMYFYRDYAIHGAYWHWRFGTRVSHGCVNLKLPDAKMMYNWAIIGTPVNIYSSIK